MAQLTGELGETMGKQQKRTEAGSGGKRGHSNMSHWDETEHIKAWCRQARRANDLLAVEEGLADGHCGSPPPGACLGPKVLTATVLQLARHIDSTHDFSALPILADALEDAG